jgi:hypothetical protein
VYNFVINAMADTTSGTKVTYLPYSDGNFEGAEGIDWRDELRRMGMSHPCGRCTLRELMSDLLSPPSGAFASKAEEVAHFHCNGCSLKHTAAITSHVKDGKTYYEVKHQCFGQQPPKQVVYYMPHLVNETPNKRGFACKLVGSTEAQ